jgi:uncharacterized membrane protein
MDTLYEVAWQFMIYAFIGWIWETALVSFREKKFVNRGFLRGPIIPIYGFGAVAIMTSMKPITLLLIWAPLSNVLISMIYIGIIATTLEYLTSLAMEVLFKTRWWDYTKHRFNIKGRISLHVSIFWGIGGFCLWRFVNQPVMWLYDVLSFEGITVIFVCFYALTLVDTVWTVIELVNLRGVVIRIHSASEEAIGQLIERVEQFTENLDAFTDNFSENIEEYKVDLSHRLEIAKRAIKRNALHVKYEGLLLLTDLVDEVRSRGKNWASDQDRALIKASDQFKKVRKHLRFFKHYPNARSKHFKSKD